MKIVLLDTNFLISVLKNKINLDLALDSLICERYEKRIIDKTMGELQKLDNEYSRLSISIITKQNIKKIKSTTNDVDSEILKNSDNNTLVATLDNELKKRLKSKGIKTISIRQKKYFRINH